MKIKISFHPQFAKDFKRLSKKYISLVSDLKDFTIELQSNPELGKDLGHGLRKVRMPISSKGKGKSGGARIITFKRIITEDTLIRIVLLTIYDVSIQPLFCLYDY